MLLGYLIWLFSFRVCVLILPFYFCFLVNILECGQVELKKLTPIVYGNVAQAVTLFEFVWNSTEVVGLFIIWVLRNGCLE